MTARFLLKKFSPRLHPPPFYDINEWITYVTPPGEQGEFCGLNAGAAKKLAYVAKRYYLEDQKQSDIAQELGVSTATVSNVIHGKTKKISDQTVRRVQEALERRQYVPSMAGILWPRTAPGLWARRSAARGPTGVTPWRTVWFPPP